MPFTIVRSLFHVALISQLCNSQSCTTQKSSSCIFPFEYQNETYSGCSIEKVKAGRSWCSIDVDESGKHVKGKKGITWDLCSSDCPVDQDPDSICKETTQCVNKDDCPQYQQFKNIPKRNRPLDYQTQRKNWIASICNKKKNKLCCPESILLPATRETSNTPSTNSKPLQSIILPDLDTKCKESTQCVNKDDCPQYQQFKNIPRGKRPLDYQTQRNNWVTSICNKKENKLCCPEIVLLPPTRKTSKTASTKPISAFESIKPINCSSMSCSTVIILPPKTKTSTTQSNPFVSKPQLNICNETQEYSGAYLPTLGQCGKLCSAGRIFGGINAKLGEFPWAVLIGYKVRKRRKTWPEQKWVRYWADEYRCGGTLINTRYVLTAAHCNGGLSKIKSVILGEWQVGVDPDCPYGNKHPQSCKPSNQVIEVESIVIHEDYRDNKINGAGVVNDIALLRLKNHADLNEAVQPICLPLNQEEAAEEIGADDLVEGIIGREATVIGWGTTKNWQKTNNITGVAHDILQKVDLTLISNEYCQSQLEDLPGDLIIQETHFCAGNHTKKDSCKGDSGGGMFINKKLGEKTDDTSYQIGIVSFGLSKCGIGYPAVYTRISEFIPWIKQNIHD